MGVHHLTEQRGVVAIGLGERERGVSEGRREGNNTSRGEQISEEHVETP